MFSTRAIFRFMRSYIWIIAILIGAVVYFMYKYLKGKSEIVTPPIPDIPNNGVNIPSGYLATATKLSEDLFTVTSGVFTWAAQKESVFVSLFNLTDDQKRLFTFGVVNTLAGDKDVLLQAKANDQGTFAEGDFKDKVLDAIATQVEGQKDMGRQILAKDKLSVYVKLLAELAHERLRERADELGIKTT